MEAFDDEDAALPGEGGAMGSGDIFMGNPTNSVAIGGDEETDDYFGPTANSDDDQMATDDEGGSNDEINVDEIDAGLDYEYHSER